MSIGFRDGKQPGNSDFCVVDWRVRASTEAGKVSAAIVVKERGRAGQARKAQNVEEGYDRTVTRGDREKK